MGAAISSTVSSELCAPPIICPTCAQCSTIKDGPVLSCPDSKALITCYKNIIDKLVIHIQNPNIAIDQALLNQLFIFIMSYEALYNYATQQGVITYFSDPANQLFYTQTGLAQKSLSTTLSTQKISNQRLINKGQFNPPITTWVPAPKLDIIAKAYNELINNSGSVTDFEKSLY